MSISSSLLIAASRVQEFEAALSDIRFCLGVYQAHVADPLKATADMDRLKALKQLVHACQRGTTL